MRLRKAIFCIFKRIYIPLRLKLFLSHLFVAIMPAFIISYACYNIYSSSVLSETSGRMESLVSQTTAELDNTFDSMKTLLLSSYVSSRIKDILYNPQWISQESSEKKMEDYNRINDFLKGILYLRKNISSIRLIPTSGISIIWHENSLSMGYPHPEIPWYQQMVDADIYEVFIPPHKPLPPSSSNEKNVFTIGKLIRDPQGNTLSILMLDMKTDEVNDIINRASAVNNLQVAILNNDSSIIFTSNNLQYNKFMDNETFTKINSNFSGTLNYEINGEKYLLMYDTSSVTGWKLVAFTKVSTLLKKAYQIRNFSYFVGLFSIILSLLLSVLLSVRLTIPIKKLYSSMEDVKNKNFDVHLIPSSNDEIGELTRNFNSMVRRIKNLIVKEYEADLKRKEAELKALESQINPHFLYNTLETISSIAYLKDIPEITTISRSLSQLFRYSIDGKKKLVTLADELYHTLNYINIQKIRHGNKFSVDVDIDEALKEYKVIKLILQPLIENSVNHGLELIKNNGIIAISAKVDESFNLIIQIEDNGIGISPKKLSIIQNYLNNKSDDTSFETTNSIGLANVHFRIQHYYGESYGLTIESNNENKTRVTIKLPAVK